MSAGKLHRRETLCQPKTMPFAPFFRRGRRRHAVASAYRQIVERARDPAFFLDWGVPDTFDGRFELVALHAFLVLNRLKAERALSAEFSQDLFDTMFADLDRALREMGATDVGVGRHVKAMARGFYGRIVAYERGFAAGGAALAEALQRNLFGTAPPQPEALAAASGYLRRQAAALAAAPVATLLDGHVPFAPAAEA
jgi:cytochrome b pre-mRNA-processing protein 3